MKPIVAIVGRPNVGKSTLVNRIAQTADAIVHQSRGVTRDRSYHEADWNGRSFTLVDTGGIEPLKSEDVFSASIRDQALAACEEAAVILFVVDGTTGVTEEDESVARMLKRVKAPVFLLVNKLDNPDREGDNLWEFYSLGVGEPIAISALHGHGTGDLLDEVVALFPEEDDLTAEPSDPNSLSVAIIGRPNAGKSSLFNKIIGSDRSIVSDIAGTTRDAIDTVVERNGKHYRMVDTAGIRKKSTVYENIEYYSMVRGLRAIDRADVALLVVDASQGIEAQTLANTYLAMEHDLEIRPVLNKIDLPAADPKRVKQEIEDILAIPAEDAPEISAKQGINIDAVLEDLVQNLPCPQGDPNAPLQALIFDSYYDAYRGVIVYMRLKQGTIKPGMEVKMMATGATFKVLECGLMRPLGLEPAKQLEAGQVGYFTASIKDVHETQIGDTVTGVEHPASEPLPGYRKVRSMVYCGIYTEDGSKYPDLRDALEKLQLNDASLTFEPESSVALGFGFRCGFLGMLHMEVIQERLEREFDLDLVTTLPSVIYEVYKTDGTMVRVDNPHNYPDPAHIEHAEEPYVKVTIVTPPDYVGNIMPMCQDRRGEFKDMQYLDTHLVELHYQMPLNEIIYDFFDTLKANTKGYASLDYELSGYRTSDLVKVDLLLNGDGVDALSFIAHRDKAYPRARRLCEKLKENIPRQLFEVPIQAAIGGRIIARETVKAMRKDVLAKCYGGDISRKKKLLEKQKEGKKKMRNLGTVQVPTEAFMAVLKLDSD